MVEETLNEFHLKFINNLVYTIHIQALKHATPTEWHTLINSAVAS